MKMNKGNIKRRAAETIEDELRGSSRRSKTKE